MLMSDKELEALKEKRLQELRRKLALQEGEKEPEEKIATHRILNRIFKGRAWEVYNAAQAQFPSAMPEIERMLVKLALEERIADVDGEQLLGLFRDIGLPVRLNTTISILSHGKTKSLSEKFREATQ